MVVIASLVLPHGEFRVRASCPVELEVDSGRIVSGVGDDLLKNGAQDALL